TEVPPLGDFVWTALAMALCPCPVFGTSVDGQFVHPGSKGNGAALNQLGKRRPCPDPGTILNEVKLMTHDKQRPLDVNFALQLPAPGMARERLARFLRQLEGQRQSDMPSSQGRQQIEAVIRAGIRQAEHQCPADKGQLWRKSLLS